MRTLVTIAVVATAACSGSKVPAPAAAPTAASNATVLLTADVPWEQLNPARGDQSPQAGTLWGDRNGTGPTGFLFKPVDGFRSPPHIHNVSYRGVVISGVVHNDHPSAADVWMPAGSYWTQPKGGVHITAARGSDTLAYIEIDEGPYLVRPVERAFDSGEKPVNVDASKIVWSDAPAAATGVKVAVLWGDPGDAQPSGVLIKLPAQFAGTLPRINATKDEYENALRASNVKFESFVYPGTKHGFHNNSTPRYDDAAAKLAWRRTVELFRRKLA